ncbi:Protein T20F5.6 [Aphelenchoides avenae]|nr:Protein T20F5.6 [Aphelenchus avenae]
MSANGNPVVQPKECPVCQEPFNIGVNLPKVFGVCGQSVCAVCLPGCILRPPGKRPRAICPLCRQKTTLPPNGLPTNYDLKDSIEAQQAASNTSNVKCSGCEKNAPSSNVFACKPCTTSEKKVILVCAKCVVKVHKAHDVVDYDAMAKAADFVSVMRDDRLHNDIVQRHTAELASTVVAEVERLAKDCQVYVDANLPLSLRTREEHEAHAKTSRKRRQRRLNILG